MNTIANEIRIHNEAGDSTSIGGPAIRLNLNKAFTPPTTAGYHIYNTAGTLIRTLDNYQEALDTARKPDHIVAWREDLNPSQTS